MMPLLATLDGETVAPVARAPAYVCGGGAIRVMRGPPRLLTLLEAQRLFAELSRCVIELEQRRDYRRAAIVNQDAVDLFAAIYDAELDLARP